MGSMDCTDLTHDRDQCSALVKKVIHLRFHEMLVSCCVASQLVASREGFSSMESIM
jgi:hypothetical protein